MRIRFFDGDGGIIPTPGDPNPGPRPVTEVPTKSSASASLSSQAKAAAGEFAIELAGPSPFCVEFDHVARTLPP